MMAGLSKFMQTPQGMDMGMSLLKGLMPSGPKPVNSGPPQMFTGQPQQRPLPGLVPMRAGMGLY